MTPMGRPVNTHNQVRWKPLDEEIVDDKIESTEIDPDWSRVEKGKSRLNHIEQKNLNFYSNFNDIFVPVP